MQRAFRGIVAALGLLGLPMLAAAEDDNGCDIDIKHDIRVSAERVSVADGDEPLYDIVQGGALSIRGEPVDLNGDQRALVEDYAGELSALGAGRSRLASRGPDPSRSLAGPARPTLTQGNVG